MKCISPVYVAKVKMHVPCGKCAFCIKKRIDGWCLRIGHEMDVSSNAFFITLTYNDENLPQNGELSKRDLQLFIKRLRKINPGIRYYAVGEYGTDLKRPHYHAIIFNLLDLSLITRTWTTKGGNPIGHILGARATKGAIRYMVSYMALPQAPTGRTNKPFALMSRNPGLGHNYIVKMKNFHKARSDSVVYDFDCANAMPRYYKDKIFNVHERAVLQKKAMDYTYKNYQVACPVEHDRLLKKLSRKV